MFDTHAHLADPRFDPDRREVIQNARDNGLSGIICVCSDLERLGIFYRLLEEYPFVYGAVGVHPHDASTYLHLQDKLHQALQHKKIVALGEIGLDYHYQNSPRDTQKEIFAMQLDLARERELPVIIHSREAIKDTLQILEGGKVSRGVMHCFSGMEKDVEDFLGLGLFISFAGPVTFPKASETRNTARTVPVERLMVETDCPYLAPQPVRGKRNEPRYVKYVVQKIAALLETSGEEIEEVTSRNAHRLFGLATGAESV